MHPFFESLAITNAPSLHASLMDIHHHTSFKFILEDDSIFLTLRTCTHSCLGKGARLWLIVRRYIFSFYITHFTFTLTLCFRFDLIQPLAFNLLTCEYGHGLNASNTLFIGSSTNSHTWHHWKHHVCPCLKEWAHYMEKTVVHLYVKSFFTNQLLHDLWGPCICWWCGGYWPNMGDNGYECHYSTNMSNYKTYHHC